MYLGTSDAIDLAKEIMETIDKNPELTLHKLRQLNSLQSMYLFGVIQGMVEEENLGVLRSLMTLLLINMNISQN